MASSCKRKYEEMDGCDNDDDDHYGSDTDVEPSDEEEDWQASMEDATVEEQCQPDRKLRRLSTSQHAPGEEDTSRVIVHVDVDCFYAQVEMIRDPSLRDKPLGIQQKYLVVTCNYVARRWGVTKLMGVQQAQELCPDLVLVRGEDLTHYRDMSYRITEVLQKFSPLVERLGFDENFVDVTEAVETRMKSSPFCSFIGHIFPEKEIKDADLRVARHQRLACGSQMAAEMRRALHSQLGITCCAGVSHNKLLAKLVAGQHKPNQQTTLLPEGVPTLMGMLKTAREIPGIGSRTFKKLQVLGVCTLQDLQAAPADVLQEEFGPQAAVTMQQLCRGVDPSPVTTTGPPQTISDEDSFKKCTSLQNAKERMTGLLQNLMRRLKVDGRIPHVLRVTVRKLSATNKWTNRESRQCAVPTHMFGTVGNASTDEDTISRLLDLCVGLFCKMVDVKHPFHLTLINICFAKLEPRSKHSASIKSFFQSDPMSTQTLEKSPTQHPQSVSQQLQTFKGKSSKSSIDSFFRPHQRSSTCTSSEAQHKPYGASIADCTTASPSVSSFFSTRDVRNDSFESGCATEMCHLSYDTSLTSNDISYCSTISSTDKASSQCSFGTPVPPSSSPETEPNLLGDFRTLPSGIDLEVFRELPPEIQKEICANYKEGGDADSTASTSQSGIAAKEESQNVETLRQGNHLTCKVPQRNEATRERVPRLVDTSTASCTTESKSAATVEHSTLPPDIDPAVFSQLPREMRVELLSSWQKSNSLRDSAQKDRRTQAKKAGKSPGIAKYFKKIDG